MPDLVLLDLNLPDVNGMIILHQMRNNNDFEHTPVVIISVEDDPVTRMKALGAGANDFILKPFRTIELLARLKTVLLWKMSERFRQRRMEYLIEAGRILLSTLNPDHVLQRVMEIIRMGLNAEGSSVWLESRSGKIICRAASGKNSRQLLGMQVGLGQGLVGWTLQHRQSVLVPDVKKDPRFLSHIDDQIQFETRDLLAVPLIVRGGSFGVLEAVNKKDGTFTDADVTWLEVLASLAAAGIANAQSFKKLQQRTIELETRNQELDTFAHTVAHDLQNPLALIIGFAEVLEKELVDLPPDEVQRYLRTIAQTGRKMDNIINELILLAQIREAEIQVYPLNMAQIVDAALERLAYTIDKKQAEIIKPAPSAWPVALGYAPWIEEVWTNYISNALKYGGRLDRGIPPHIELGFSTEEIKSADQRSGKSTQSHSTRPHIRFWVGDNGRGLTVEEQTKLFKPFTRLIQIQAKGHGLGLSIVRRIMDKLNGEVGIESEVERGSYFYFTLPPHNDQPATTTPEKTRIIEDISYSTTDKLKENVVPLPG